jgi:hypothetical protein
MQHYPTGDKNMWVQCKLQVACALLLGSSLSQGLLCSVMFWRHLHHYDQTCHTVSSAAAAAAVLQSVKSGCFAQYTKAICKDPASASMQLGL